ncbi:MAG: hypothetical protein V7K32_06925 [Nostoc sp.]|uniref:hypothetical protein n=1 Tax=Nostoc sp. TaxID=1180 RepID=UPI002FFA09CE
MGRKAIGVNLTNKSGKRKRSRVALTPSPSPIFGRGAGGEGKTHTVRRFQQNVDTNGILPVPCICRRAKCPPYKNHPLIQQRPGSGQHLDDA